MRIGYILLQFPVVSETFIMNELIELIHKGREVYIFTRTFKEGFKGEMCR